MPSEESPTPHLHRKKKPEGEPLTGTLPPVLCFSALLLPLCCSALQSPRSGPLQLHQEAETMKVTSSSPRALSSPAFSS